MPRIPRESLNSQYFHVIVQGIEKKYIFKEKKEKNKYKRLLLDNLEASKIELLGYCIMNNHAHMLIYVDKIQTLSNYMQRINTAYSLYFNKKENRVGYLFRDRFRSVPIFTVGQLYRTLVYIHLNPVSAGICDNPEGYYYSSYNEYVNLKGIVTTKVLARMGFVEKNYVERFKFLHLFKQNGEEFEREDKAIGVASRIEEYIRKENIVDIIFQYDKVKKMIDELEKEKISFSRIAKYLGISKKRLQEIISG